MQTLLTISKDQIDLPAGSEVLLRQQTWTDYEALLASRQNHAAIKISFDAQAQEIRLMSPLPRHSKQSDTLSDLVKLILRYQNSDWESFDPLTLKRFERRGLEPNACFYIQNRTAILGKEQINLDLDPPPDLAIEVDLTSLTKPTDYRDIGVPELWIYRQPLLSIYLFDGQDYQESEQSQIFPAIPVKQCLPEYIERAWVAGSSVALREFEAYLEAYLQG
jgi:Uma2 family endonuclease